MRVIGWLLLGLLAIFAAYCLLLAVSALLVSTKKEYRHDSPFYRWLLDSSIRLAVPILRIHVDVRGLEQLPQDTPVFFVGNHRSNFDPILTWYVLRKYRIGYLSKAENFRIPLYGRIIRRCGCTACKPRREASAHTRRVRGTRRQSGFSPSTTACSRPRSGRMRRSQC